MMCGMMNNKNAIVVFLQSLVFTNYLTCALLRVEYFFFKKNSVHVDFYDMFLYIKKISGGI